MSEHLSLSCGKVKVKQDWRFRIQKCVLVTSQRKTFWSFGFHIHYDVINFIFTGGAGHNDSNHVRILDSEQNHSRVSINFVQDIISMIYSVMKGFPRRCYIYFRQEIKYMTLFIVLLEWPLMFCFACSLRKQEYIVADTFSISFHRCDNMIVYLWRYPGSNRKITRT